MKKIPYVCLYRSYFKELEEFTDEQIGRLVRGLLSYLLTEQEPELGFPERYFWPRLREQHDRDTEHYEGICEKNRINRLKRKEKTTVDDGIQLFTMEGKEKEKEIEKDKEKEKEKEKDSLSLIGEEREISTFPDLEEVADFCLQNGITEVEAQHFVDYYNATGWKVGSKPMGDWKAMVRLWQRRARAEKADTPMAVSYGTLL